MLCKLVLVDGFMVVMLVMVVGLNDWGGVCVVGIMFLPLRRPRTCVPFEAARPRYGPGKDAQSFSRFIRLIPVWIRQASLMASSDLRWVLSKIVA